MQDIFDTIEATGIFPVVEIENLEDATSVAEALRCGGINAVEITLRTPCAYDAIRAVTRAFPEMLVGAGTVLTPAQATDAINAGAKYVVAPGYNPTVVQHCLKSDIPVIPGVDSPSGIEMALEAGLSVLKFFPAESRGGFSGLRSMTAPFKKQVRFIPLGGITPETTTDYAGSDIVLAVGGTWIANNALIQQKNFARITENARNALVRLHGFELAGLRVETQGNRKDMELLQTLSKIFSMSQGNNGVLTSDALSAPEYSGTIKIACNNLRRGRMWLQRQGIGICQDSGNTLLEQMPGGFRIELIEKTVE